MFQVRFHGRGGQGVVTAAELLSVAAFDEGRVAQAIPSFGSERMGAPVVAFCRIADGPIRTREPVVAPDAVVIGDPTLVHGVDLLAGLVPGGAVLVNTSTGPAEAAVSLGVAELGAGAAPVPGGSPSDGGAPSESVPTAPSRRSVRLATVPATELAVRHVGRAVPNAALLGGLAALCGTVEIESVVAALQARFGGSVAKGNVRAATAGFEVVRAQLAGATGAMPGAEEVRAGAGPG